MPVWNPGKRSRLQLAAVDAVAQIKLSTKIRYFRSHVTNWELALPGGNRAVTKSFPARAQGQCFSLKASAQLISSQAGQATFMPFVQGKRAQLWSRALKVTLGKRHIQKMFFLCHYSAVGLSSLKHRNSSASANISNRRYSHLFSLKEI